MTSSSINVFRGEDLNYCFKLQQFLHSSYEMHYFSPLIISNRLLLQDGSLKNGDHLLAVGEVRLWGMGAEQVRPNYEKNILES